MAVNPASIGAVPLYQERLNRTSSVLRCCSGIRLLPGNIEIVLRGRMLGLKSDNNVASGLSAVEQLRCSVQAASNLRGALDCQTCVKPVSAAIERIDQCVASAGAVRNVRSITAAT